MSHRTAITSIALVIAFGCEAAEAARIKDISRVVGMRDNQLVGYGLVVGLNGSGDSQQTQFTVQSVVNMLFKFGVTVPASKVRTNNVAAVMVTATLPAFMKSGDKIDAVVSSIGDAKSLQGGTLLQTPLQGADSEVYAVAQGPVSIGGFVVGTGGNEVQKNHVTVGRVPNGAVVEKEVPVTMSEGNTITLSLSSVDFTTARRVAEAIATKLGSGAATAVDAATVRVSIPAEEQDRLPDLIAEIGQLTVTPDQAARVVINERTGTVIIGGEVRISPVAVAHGSLSVEVKTELQVSQPSPLAGGETVVVAQTRTEVKEEEARLMELKSGDTIGDLVTGLNALGVTPRDMIAILQAVKDAGALQAELQIM